jgi:hypothetical protein
LSELKKKLKLPLKELVRILGLRAEARILAHQESEN